MSKLKGNLIFGQSGGPTSVINASAAGVFIEALKYGDTIEKVYGAHHGIAGILNEDFFLMNEEESEELELLKYTPSSALGSVRYKLADPAKDDTDYKRMLEVFKKYNIRYFFYNGGNDSMDTVNKISQYMEEHGWEMRAMGVCKTIDNDLVGTDHCPGYGSAAKYVATTLTEVYQDATVYDSPQITVVEIMGRHAGWLAASAALARVAGFGPDLIYLPEVPFTVEQLYKDVDKVLEKKNKVIIAVSEGVSDADGVFLAESIGAIEVDSFGHKQLSGTGAVVEDLLKERYDVKIRTLEFSLMQRAAAHLASATDIEEAFNCGAVAVNEAVNGKTGYMVGLERNYDTAAYDVSYALIPLAEVANAEKAFPSEWINEEGNNVTDDYIDYALPLIQGETEMPKINGLPRFARLKKVQGGNPTNYLNRA